MGRFREVFGVVIHNAGNGAFYAWCPSIPQDIVIDQRYCPPNEDILAKWVKVEIDESLHVRQTVVIIDDRYESRPSGKFAEVKVEIQHRGNCENQFEMYDHHYFGFICDPRHVIERVEQNASYYVWITGKRQHGYNSRWMVSTENEQVNPLPPANHDNRPNMGPDDRLFRRRQSPESFHSGNRHRSMSSDRVQGLNQRYESNSYGGNQAPSRYQSPPHSEYDNRSHRRRSRSSGMRNQYQDGYVSDRNRPYSRNRSPERNYLHDMKDHHPHNRDFPYERPNEHIHGGQYSRHISPPVASRPTFGRQMPLEYGNHSNGRLSRSPERRNNCNQSNRPQSPTASNNFLQDNRSSQYQIPATSISTQLNRVQAQNRRRSSSSRSTISRAETTDSEDDCDNSYKGFKCVLTNPRISARQENPGRRSDLITKSENNQKNMVSADAEHLGKAINVQKVVTSSDVPPYNPYGNPTDLGASKNSNAVPKLQKSAEDKEMKRLKSRLIHMKRLVLSLTADENVSREMKLLNVEEYEELISLAKQED